MSDEKKLKCLECNKDVANSPNVLSRHVRSVHNMEWAEYIVKYEFNGQWPTCACSCGEKLAWKKGGFGKYIRGHDNKQEMPISYMGWFVNPFTGREEHISIDDEAVLMHHFVNTNDPVTHDHGIKVCWEDSSGKLKFVQPGFKHLKKKLIISVDNPSDVDYRRRLTGFKEWCDTHQYQLLILKRVDDTFNVVGGHLPNKKVKVT